MPYEYVFETVRLADEDIKSGGLTDWLNLFGAHDWRLNNLRTTAVDHLDQVDFFGIFERRIEINRKLREEQKKGDRQWRNETLESSD